MTSRTTNRFSPEVRERAVRMAMDHERDHPSRRAAVVSIAAKIGCTAQTLRIPIQAGHPFRDEAGQRSDLMSDGVPR